MNHIQDSTHLIGTEGGYVNAYPYAALHTDHHQASFIQLLSRNIAIMVGFCKLKLSDIGGIANLAQARHINKCISEQTNINLYIT